MFPPRRSAIQASRGQALVETALVLPILVLLLLMGIDFGRVFFTSIDLRNAAHEATMVGGTDPDVACAILAEVVDRQMGRDDPAATNTAVCGVLTAVADVVHITLSECESDDITIVCPAPSYPAAANLRYAVRLEYRFQPVVGLVGLLTGNGVGGSIPLGVENRSPVLVDYEGA